MRVELQPILESTRRLLVDIEARLPARGASTASLILRLLPPDNFAETAPGMSICYSMQEWQFKNVLPFLRGSTAKWLEWLESPSGDWPEPKTLRAAVAALEGIAASMAEGETHQNASVS